MCVNSSWRFTLLLLCIGVFACDPKPDPALTPQAPPSQETLVTTSPALTPTTLKDPASDSAPLVTVDALGVKFDPAITLAQLPDDVWFCDMGTSHYARKAQGDGKCPICSMALKHKLANADEHGDHEHH